MSDPPKALREFGPTRSKLPIRNMVAAANSLNLDLPIPTSALSKARVVVNLQPTSFAKIKVMPAPWGMKFGDGDPITQFTRLYL